MGLNGAETNSEIARIFWHPTYQQLLHSDISINNISIAVYSYWIETNCFAFENNESSLLLVCTGGRGETDTGDGHQREWCKGVST